MLVWEGGKFHTHHVDLPHFFACYRTAVDVKTGGDCSQRLPAHRLAFPHLLTYRWTAAGEDNNAACARHFGGTHRHLLFATCPTATFHLLHTSWRALAMLPRPLGLSLPLTVALHGTTPAACSKRRHGRARICAASHCHHAATSAGQAARSDVGDLYLGHRSYSVPPAAKLMPHC